MKLKSAINKAHKVAERLKSTHGLIYTPLHEYEAIRVKRAWLFGSTSKLKEEPNDVDILVEMVGIDRYKYGVRGSYIIDKEYLRRYGMRIPKDSMVVASKFLKNRLHHVNVHATDWVSFDPDVKILIYPRNDLDLRLKFSHSSN